MDFLIFINKWSTQLIVFFGTLSTIYIFFNRVLKKLEPYTNITDNIESINNEIKNIKKELTSNSGSSLKDIVAQIKKDVKSNTELTTTIFYRQRWILDNRSEPIFETDKEGNFTWVNESFIKLTDRGFKDLKDNNWINILKEDTRNSVANDWYLAVESERNFEKIVTIIDNKNISFTAKIMANRQEDGNYIGALANVQKIERGFYKD